MLVSVLLQGFLQEKGMHFRVHLVVKGIYFSCKLKLEAVIYVVEFLDGTLDPLHLAEAGYGLMVRRLLLRGCSEV